MTFRPPAPIAGPKPKAVDLRAGEVERHSDAGHVAGEDVDVCLSIPPMEARGSRFNVPAIAFVKGSARSVFTDSQRRCVSAIRSLASAMPPGTLNLMRVMRLPPIGSSASRMLTDRSVRGSRQRLSASRPRTGSRRIWPEMGSG